MGAEVSAEETLFPEGTWAFHVIKPEAGNFHDSVAIGIGLRMDQTKMGVALRGATCV